MTTQMINNLNPTTLQMELVALLSFAFIMLILWINRDKNNQFEEKVIKLFAFVCAALVVGMFVYMIYTIVGGI